MFFSSLDNSFRKVFGVSPHRQNNARLRFKFFISFTAKAGFCAEWRRRGKQVTQQSYILFKPFLHEYSFSKTAVLTVHMMYQVIFPNSGALCMPNIALRSIVGCWQLKIWIRDKVHCVSRLRLLSALYTWSVPCTFCQSGFVCHDPVLLGHLVSYSVAAPLLT